MLNDTVKTDVLIIGASAAGLMCAIEAGKRGRKVIVLDHANRAGKKILMSGGGRCNFTNMNVDAENYISHNPHFCKSALSRYTQWDFIAMVDQYGIAYHERDLGKLFCDESAKDILNMLLTECDKYDVIIQLNITIKNITRSESEKYISELNNKTIQSESLVVASGGLSIPKMCASPLGYKLAQQFGIKLRPTSAGLVPFTLQPEDKEKLQQLSGVSILCDVSNEAIHFKENILFTHRGLSGPAILQISSYWKPGEVIHIDLLPDIDLLILFKEKQATQAKIKLKSVLNEILPKRFVSILFDQHLLEKTLQEISNVLIGTISNQLHQWQIKPGGTEGYRTAEVTLGGVDCDELSSKTMESKKVPGLYFIGEVVDVTGWLGGYNFQWAWSSGWSAGQFV